MLEKASKLTMEHPDSGRLLEETFRGFAQLQARLTLENLYRKRLDFKARNKNFVVIDFPERYLEAIEGIAFPEWYTACFMSECTNSSIWGNYAVNHTGVCLVFEGEDAANGHFLSLKGTIGHSPTGPVKGKQRRQFHPVSYSEGYAKIDFFRSLGRLPGPTVNSTWYCDADKNASVCSQEFFDDPEAWHRKYWETFLGDTLRKTKDWAYENEYRLVLHGVVADYSSPENRTLTYDFESLKGLIFGINTRIEDKLRIIDIIDRKCKDNKRADFKFYQAYYSPTTRDIGHVELTNLIAAHAS